MPTRKSDLRTLALWAGLTLALDLVTKTLALDSISPWKPTAVIPGFFNLVLTYNTGAAFSIFASDSSPGQGLKMALLSLVSLLPFVYLFLKSKTRGRLFVASLGLILGGALGNIHDRLRWEAVVDFLDFYWGDYHWPAFNVADIAICVGAGLLILSILREKPAPANPAESQNLKEKGGGVSSRPV